MPSRLLSDLCDQAVPTIQMHHVYHSTLNLIARIALAQAGALRPSGTSVRHLAWRIDPASLRTCGAPSPRVSPPRYSPLPGGRTAAPSVQKRRYYDLVGRLGSRLDRAGRPAPEPAHPPGGPADTRGFRCRAPSCRYQWRPYPQCHHGMPSGGVRLEGDSSTPQRSEIGFGSTSEILRSSPQLRDPSGGALWGVWTGPRVTAGGSVQCSQRVPHQLYSG